MFSEVFSQALVIGSDTPNEQPHRVERPEHPNNNRVIAS